MLLLPRATPPLAARHPVLCAPGFLAQQQCQCWVAAIAPRISLHSPLSLDVGAPIGLDHHSEGALLAGLSE